MKPVQQIFALVLEEIWKRSNKLNKLKKFHQEVESLRKTTEEEKFEDKLDKLKNKEVKALLFDAYLRKTTNDKEGNQSILKFLKK